MRKIWRLLGFLPLLILAIGLCEASLSVYRTGVAYGLIDPAGLGRYRLYVADTGRFVEEIETAIADGDYPYAESLYDLGIAYGHELPPDLKERAQATWPRRLMASGSRAAQGFIFGTVDSGEEIVGTLASDLVGIGDLRDFSVQGFNYMSGRDYDTLLLGLSAVGLGLTAASYSSFGLAAAPDAGLSLVKNAYRSRKLSKPLTAYFSRAAGKALDKHILKTELKAAGEGASGVGRIEKAAARSVDKTAASTLLDDAAVLDDMRRAGGVKTSMAALMIADGPKDLRKLQRVAAHFGDDGYAVMKFLGRSLLRIGYGLAEIAMALASFVLMILMAAARWPLRAAIRFGLARLGFSAYVIRALRPVTKLW